MAWQKARFLPPTRYPEPFWVEVGAPTFHRHPPLKDDLSGFDFDDLREGFWYRTNVLSPTGHFFLWAPHEGVELISEFAESVEPDQRCLEKEQR
jgi:hypothetical protein